ncbi:MAG: diaminopimelate epimerase [Actinobacteria bacterium]|nr:diaminopimelate epimerase [Actinomycetota bacterium]
MTELRFAKYHGTGNDFVMIEDLEGTELLDPDLIAEICDRHRGVGADGLIRITRAENEDFFMDYSNADGSVAEMCGNGIRCLGKLVYERGLTEKTELDIGTRAGPKHLSLEVRDGLVESVTVGMGTPAFAKSAIPMRGPAWESFLAEPFEVEGMTLKASAVSMGNPHLVLFVEDDPDRFPVERIGPAVERHDLFPERTNVEFVAVQDDGLKARVWERGIGETMACGTGACAALVAANEAGLVPARAAVRFRGVGGVG